MLMVAEAQEDYELALKKIQNRLYRPPAVVGFDTDRAFINAVKAIWPTTLIILCRWHIWQNVKSNCMKNFKDEKGKHDGKAFAKFKKLERVFSEFAKYAVSLTFCRHCVENGINWNRPIQGRRFMNSGIH